MDLNVNKKTFEVFKQMKETPATQPPTAAPPQAEDHKATKRNHSEDHHATMTGTVIGHAHPVLPLGQNEGIALVKQILDAKGPQRDDLLMNFSDQLDQMSSFELEATANYLADRAAKPNNDNEEPTIRSLQKAINKELKSRNHFPHPMPPQPFPPKPFPPAPHPHGPGKDLGDLFNDLTQVRID